MKRVSEEIKRADERIAVLDARLADFMLTVPNRPHAPSRSGTTPPRTSKCAGGARRRNSISSRARIGKSPRAPAFSISRAPRKLPARVLRSIAALARGMERALANFFLDTHAANGYTEFLPPFIVNTAALTGVGQLPKFAADMFHLEGTDLWLTPTAEVELTSYYRDETLDADLLPIKVCAWTACFRSEAGAAGKDTRGLKRQHQFQKVETVQVHAARPKAMRNWNRWSPTRKPLLQKLGLHYRVVLLCTGDMGFASAKTYDIEVWLPSAGEFMEISSCSNTEAFQARRSGIRFKPKTGKSEFVHTLNGSGLAVGRTWLAIVENYQQADGSVLIPEALRPYMGTDRFLRSLESILVAQARLSDAWAISHRQACY